MKTTNFQDWDSDNSAHYPRNNNNNGGGESEGYDSEQAWKFRNHLKKTLAKKNNHAVFYELPIEIVIR